MKQFIFQQRFFIVIAVVVLVAGGAAFYFWRQPQYPPEYAQGMKLVEDYKAAMRADTAGGKTPQATLDLFVAALKKEDVALASTYFMLDDNGSRERWVKRLGDIQQKGLLVVMANDIEKRLKPDSKNIISETDFKFVLLKDDGSVGASIDMELNKYSGVWKIESL